VSVYWTMYLLPMLMALSPFRGTRHLRLAGWWVAGIAYGLLIGLRYEVGGDWLPYLENSLVFSRMDFVESIFLTDPGYVAVDWISANAGAGIYGVNLVCGGIFMAGLISFSRKQPLPWLAFAISVPYLLIVVSMGYTRQAAALGFILLGLGELQQMRVARYVMLVAAAALFHNTAVVLMPLALFTPGMVNIPRIVGVTFLFVLTAAFSLAQQFETLWFRHVVSFTESEGGAIRVWMNIVPALIFLWYWKRWRNRFTDQWLWGWFAVLSVICVSLVGIASTAVDRFALYLTPIQLVVFSRLPLLIGEPALRGAIVVTILGTYGLVLWVWLNYAVHAFAWVPYQNVLFQ